MSELSLRDLGLEPDVPDVEMPLVEEHEMNKAKEVIRWTSPERYRHDPVLHRYSCELLSSNGRDTYDVTISFNANKNAWATWSCSCPNSRGFDAPCKHILAFFIFLVEKIHPNSILSPDPPVTAKRKPSGALSRKSTITRATSKPNPTHTNSTTTVAAKKPPVAAPSSAITNAAPAVSSLSSAVSHDHTSLQHPAPALAARAMSPALPLHQVVPTHAAPSSTTAHQHAHPHHAPPVSHFLQSNQGVNHAASPLIPPPSVPSSVTGGHHAAAVRKEIWKCALCGTKNTGAGTRCRECQAIRKTDADSLPSSLSTFAASSAQRAADVQSLSWKCHICSYMNNVGLKTCKICRATRPISGSAPSINSNNTQASLAMSTTASPAVNPPTATPVPAAIPSTTSVPTPPQPVDGAMSRSFEAFPPFTAGDSAVATTDAAPKKAMSVIAEALNSQLDEPAGPSAAITGVEAEKRKRWERILNEGFSSTTRAKAAAAGASSSSEGVASSSAAKASASAAPKTPVVLQFTKGRGGRPAPAQPVLLLSKDELVKKRKAREEQESILAIMEETAAAELKARQKQEEADKKKATAAFSGRVPKSRQAKIEGEEKKKKRKRKRIGESDEEEEESEYEAESAVEVEEVKEDEAEQKTRTTGTRGVKSDVENAADSGAAVAASSSAAAAAESTAPKPARVVPRFLADIIGGKKKVARARAIAKAKIDDKMDTDEAPTAADVKPKRKPAAKRTTSAKRTTTKKATRSTRKQRGRDDDSRENSDNSGGDSEDDGGAAPMDIDEDDDDDDVPELVDRSTIADGGATLNADDVLGFMEHFNQADAASAPQKKVEKKARRQQPTATAAAVKDNSKQVKEKVIEEKKTEGSVKPTEKEKTLEERLTDTLLASKELLASTAAKGIHALPAAVATAPSNTPQRKKRKLNLADLLDHPSQLLELINRPPTQDSVELIPEEPAEQISETEKREPQKSEEDEVDALLAMDPPAAATVKRTRSSRSNSNVSALSAQPHSKTPAAAPTAPAAAPPASSKPRSEKPLSIDSDEDVAIDAALDDLLAPVLVSETAKPFKSKQETIDDATPVAAASVDPHDASDPPTNDHPAEGASGSAPANDVFMQEDEDDDDAAEMASPSLEWRKTKTPLQRELARVSKAKPRAVIRRVNAKPAAAAAPAPVAATKKKRNNRVKNESDAEEDDFMNDAPRTAAAVDAGTPSLKPHPMARFEVASARLLPLFPDLSLHAAANLLERFDDNVEKSVDHVLAHPDEFRSSIVASPVPQRRASVRVSHRSPSHSQQPQSQESLQQAESKYDEEYYEAEQKSKPKRPSRGVSMKHEVSATQADFDAQLDELLASAENPIALAAASSRSRVAAAAAAATAAARDDENDVSNDEHMDALLAQINQHDAPAAAPTSSRRSARAAAPTSSSTHASRLRRKSTSSSGAASSVGKQEESATSTSIADNYYNSADFLDRSRARIQRADKAEEKRQIRNSAAQYEAEFQAKMDEDAGTGADNEEPSYHSAIAEASAAAANAVPAGPYDFQASQEEQKLPRTFIKADADATEGADNNMDSFDASLPVAPIPMWSKKKGRVEGPTVVSVPKLIQVRQARGELHQVQMKKREIEARRTGGTSFGGVVGARTTRNTRQQRQLFDDDVPTPVTESAALSRRSSTRKRNFEEANDSVKKEEESHYEPAARNVLTRNDSLSALEHVASVAPAAASAADPEMQIGRRQDVEVRSKRRK